MQLPPLVGVTIPAAMVQLPLAAKLAGNPEDVVAITENGGSPSVRSGSGAKAMVWPARTMAKV